VTAKEMYDIDAYTMYDIGYGNLLMENAGRAVSEKVQKQAKKDDQIVVLVGGGNNGGDGYVIARTLLNQSYNVEVIQVVSDAKLTDATRFHKNLFTKCDGHVRMIDQIANVEDILQTADIVVDAITGIGVKGKLRAPLADVVSELNASARFIIAVDIPSGLPADEGIDDFIAVKADYTVIIGAPKLSLFLSETAGYYGTWDVVAIGHPPKAWQQFSSRFVISSDDFRQTMPKRSLDAHKGDHGSGLVIGGSDDMPGALAMTVKAALRTGAGLITAGSTNTAIDRVAPQCQEAMYTTLVDQNGYHSNANDLSLDRYDALVVGVGIGRHRKTKRFVMDIVRKATCPLIIDADGLYHIQSDLEVIKKRHAPTIITPHPGEMARLLGITVPELLAAPFYYAHMFAEMYQVYVVLKGRYTIVTEPSGKQAVNTTGNPGLAKGGSGDVLAGIMLAMIMQKQSIFQALCNACFLHGMSADLLVARNHSHYDLIPQDV